MGKFGMKSIPTAIAVIMLVVLVLSACSGNKNNESNEGASVSPSQAASQSPAASGTSDASAAPTLPYDPPVTITDYVCDPGAVFPDGESSTDNVHTRWAKNELGIEIKPLWIAPSADGACENKMRLDLASGAKLADVIGSFNYSFLGDFIASGQFQPIDEAFNQYASDLFKQGYESHPDIWANGKIDGQQMILPFLQTAYQNDPVLWIRTDWMDKLGLQPPKTMSELVSMMETIKNSDPDGNGKNDTIPLALALKEDYFNMMGDAQWVLGNNGALSGYGHPQSVWLEKDGQLVNADLQPEIKQGLSVLKDWIDKGYVEQDAAMKNTFDAGQLFTSGQAFMIPAAYWVPRWPFSSDFTDKNAVYQAFPLPTADDGKAMHLQSPMLGAGMIVNKDFKRLDALFAYINRIWEYTDPKPGSEFEYGFADGYDYKKNSDGTVTYDFEPKYEPITWGLASKPQLPDTELKFYYDYLNNNVQPSNNLEKGWAEDKVVLQAGAAAYAQRDSAIANAYKGPDTPTMKEKGAVLQKIVMDAYTKILYGKEPIESWDAMVEQYNKQGGEQLAKEVNEWYALNGK